VTRRLLLTEGDSPALDGDGRDRLAQGLDPWLIDSLVVPASLHDVEGRFVHMNAAAERAAGISNAKMRGRHYTELLPAEARENVEAQFRKAAERGEPTDFETIFIDGSGNLRGVRAQHLPLRAGDSIVGILILAFGVRRPRSELIGLEPHPHLTPRQSQVLELMASGRSTSEIAKELTVSAETVRNHLRSLFMQLHAHTRLEAIAAAQRLGMLALPALEPHSSNDAATGGASPHP
jgi:PAS domain S-box-containing protein